ncbi:MAG: hypothetical protein WC782_04535 [Methylococcaceae bacterium]|jgi:hypothetical protein
MSEDKEKNKLGSWFPNFNHLILVLLLGSIFVSQSSFHQFRPNKPETAVPTNPLVDARPWQDPFEALNKFEEANKSGVKANDFNGNTGLSAVQAQINAKMSTSDLEKLHIVAVMLPGEPYFEDSESRRKLRYAVLSGFGAAIRYTPENSSHIGYFYTSNTNPIAVPKHQGFDHRVTYEWLVYKPSDYNYAPKNNEVYYHRPPVLVLWLNNNEFATAPHAKLKALTKNITQEHYPHTQVSVLGPYNSDNLQDFVNEVYGMKRLSDDAQFNYFSPSATLQDSLFLKNNNPLLYQLEAKLWPKSILDTATFTISQLLTFQNPDFTAAEYPNLINALSIKAISEFMPQLDWGRQTETSNLLCQQVSLDLLKVTCSVPRQNYLLTAQQLSARQHKFNQGFELETNLNAYFKQHGIDYVRLTHTDQDFAIAIKNELRLRGIVPNEQNRIVLIGEWDTLYGWHLPNTYADELLKGLPPENCLAPDHKRQDWDTVYEPKSQCVFRFSYLRGLDGDANADKTTARKKASNDIFNADRGGESNKLEDADGDSQFDYIRRLAAQVAELDQSIRKQINTPFVHSIKAIGILGSDFYDKLLILEALHEHFPDAVFFTNGMDARLLQPEYNQWTRNLIVASAYGLALNPHFQRDIPPLRDSVQTGFFLATQLALQQSLDKDLIFDPQLKALAYDGQYQLDQWQYPPQIFELGRTRAFNLNSGYHHPKTTETSFQAIEAQIKPSQSSGYASMLALVALLIGLTLSRTSREFLHEKTGLMLSIFLTTICSFNLLYILALQKQWLPFTRADPTAAYFIFGIAYCGIMISIASVGYQHYRLGKKDIINQYCFIINALLICLALGIIWGFVQPLGWLNFNEQYAFWEGVSMWPSEAIRLFGFIIASFYIVQVWQFPQRFTQNWLNPHFHLEQSKDYPQTIIHHWLNWQNSNQRWLYPILYALVFSVVSVVIYKYFGSYHIPSRDETLRLLDDLLLRGLLFPAFSFLLFLVIDAAILCVRLTNSCFSTEEDSNPSLKPLQWPATTLAKYAEIFDMEQRDLQEWVSMRFIVELNKRIYRIIGFPLVIALLMVISRSSYFDNWNVAASFKIVICTSLCFLIYWDVQLKKAADSSRKMAVKSLQQRALAYSSANPANAAKLDKLVLMIENYDEGFYKSFSQRPIFLNSLLLLLALLADQIDYSLLSSNLF